MKRLLFGILAGVTLMYLFDPRHGQNRRQMLAERFRRGKDATSQSGDFDRPNQQTRLGRVPRDVIRSATHD